MFPSHSPEQVAIARQLIGELDRYANDLRVLLERRWDPELYRALSDRFDHIQLFAQALPRLASAWTEVLITRAELTHALWTLRAPSRINGRVVAMHALHEGQVRALRRHCRSYLGAGERD